MFASQLLRILQSIPSDVKHETCVFDPAEEDPKMKENQNSVLYGAESFKKETNPFLMENEEIHQLKSSSTDTSPLAFEVKAGDGHWNPFVDDFTEDLAKGNRFSLAQENTDGLAYSLDIEEDEFKLSSYSNSKEEKQRHECPITADEHHESRGSSSPFIADLDLHEPDTKMYTDKNVLECELPEFTVCYKEINYHIVKDICVDDGLSVMDKNSIESYKQHKEADHNEFQPRGNSRSEDAIGADMEFFIQDLAKPPLENKSRVNEDENGIDYEQCGNFDTQGKPKLPTESCLHEDAARHADSEDSEQQTGDAKCCTSGDTVTDAPKDDSFIDKKLPIQEFGTRSFLRSFMNSLDCEENRVDQLPDQVSSGKPVPGSLVTSPAEESKEGAHPTSLLYNSRVENGIITFNFNGSAPEVTERTEDLIEQTVGSGSSHDDASADSPSDDADKIDLASSSKDDGIENPPEQSVNSYDEKSDDSSATSIVQSISNGKQKLENIPVDKVENSDEIAFVDPSPHNDEGETIKPIKHEVRNSGNVPFVSHLQSGDGEASFSAAGRIAYSGPVPHSGSVSFRSDGSATSGRSFAFPVLQDEWNSSPVRMAKADRRNFRKHRGWRSGLLCCKF